MSSQSQTEEQSNEGTVNSVRPFRHGKVLLSCWRVKHVVRVGPADFLPPRLPEMNCSPKFAVVVIELIFFNPASDPVLS
jgi:hypothetical protein